MLVDDKLIKSSKVLPFRYTTAIFEIVALGAGKEARATIMALNVAIEKSVSNVPVFDGDTLVVLDTSGSMTGFGRKPDAKTPSVIGRLFSAALVKSNNADFMTFDNTARYQMLNPMDSLSTIASTIEFRNGGTNFHSIFQTMKTKYDRIIILSDMQGWIGHYNPSRAYNQYKEATGANPFIYSFDLAGQGTMQFPERNVFALAGFSEKVFDTMRLLETDRNALVNTIKAVKF